MQRSLSAVGPDAFSTLFDARAVFAVVLSLTLRQQKHQHQLLLLLLLLLLHRSCTVGLLTQDSATTASVMDSGRSMRRGGAFVARHGRDGDDSRL